MVKRQLCEGRGERSTRPKHNGHNDLHKSIIWFRSDLRIADNKALTQASSFSGTPDGVIGLYIVSPSTWKQHDWGAAKVDFIKRNLLALSADLYDTLNIPLYVINVDKFDQIPHELVKFCRTNGASAVWFNNEPEWDEIQRDTAVEKTLGQNGILCRRYEDQCIVEPGLILTKESRPYSVFTPFKNTWFSFHEANPRVLETEPQCQAPNSGPSLDQIQQQIQRCFESLPEEFILDEEKQERLKSLWPAGASEASKRLDDFVRLRIKGYSESRDFPCLADGTSTLSPYITHGIISARMCFLRAKQENEGKLYSGNAGICKWISEFCWRDFYRHILHHFPRISRGRPFKAVTDKVAWRYPSTDSAASEDFERWCRGFTGFPIVDAAMRQLNTIGWMHNRLRMVVSMFLTKDLLVRK